MESTFKKVRLIQWALLLAIPLFAWVAEIGRSKGSSDWTWRHWLAIGFCVWSGSGAFRLRSRMLRQSNEKLMRNTADAKAVKQWEAGQIISLAMAEGVAYWGLVIRMVFHGDLWQASVFYVMGALLLLFWTPRMPSGTAST
jgi:hypothetical protein